MRRGRFVIAAIIAIISLIVTGETQRVGDITPDQEVALGLQAAPEMAQQFGGLSQNAQAQELLDQTCARLISRSAAQASTEYYRYECHVLADPNTVNAFALPGGQVFITEALLDRLQTTGQLAGVMAHEIAHVVGRHGAEHMAKAQLTQGLTGAAVLATYDPNNPSSRGSAAMVALIGQLINMRFGRADELESDQLGVRFMSEAGYDPRSMVEVMRILAESGGGGRQPEFFSTHPNPENRVQRIEEAIGAQFPGGIPEGLEK